MMIQLPPRAIATLLEEEWVGGAAEG